MNKRITLDLKEYEELVSFKRAIENQNVVIVREVDFYNSPPFRYSEIYTKDSAISELADEINELRKLLNSFKRMSIWDFINFKYYKNEN